MLQHRRQGNLRGPKLERGWQSETKVAETRVVAAKDHRSRCRCRLPSFTRFSVHCLPIALTTAVNRERSHSRGVQREVWYGERGKPGRGEDRVKVL
jgi:hypothetical protein